jgi:hypothetical protein
MILQRIIISSQQSPIKDLSFWVINVMRQLSAERSKEHTPNRLRVYGNVSSVEWVDAGKSIQIRRPDRMTKIVNRDKAG